MIKPSKHDAWIIALTLEDRKAYQRDLEEIAETARGIRAILNRYQVLKAKERRDRKAKK